MLPIYEELIEISEPDTLEKDGDNLKAKFYLSDLRNYIEKNKIKAWAITDWGGGIRHPSVSIFDRKKDALIELKRLEKLPEPTTRGEPNKIVKVEIKIK